jgi:hypothetical protein
MTTIANEILILISNTRWWSDSSLPTWTMMLVLFGLNDTQSVRF